MKLATQIYIIFEQLSPHNILGFSSGFGTAICHLSSSRRCIGLQEAQQRADY
jgi:hypothetical protein